MKRSEVKAAYKWNLDSVMKAADWEDAYRALFAEKESLEAYRGKLRDKKQLLACLKAESDLSLRHVLRANERLCAPALIIWYHG